MQSRKLEKSQYVTSLVIGKHLGVQSRLIFNYFFSYFQCFSWIGKNWEVQSEKHSKIPRTLCKLGKTWKKIPILNLWINWERLCLNWSFTVDNKRYRLLGALTNADNMWNKSNSSPTLHSTIISWWPGS